MGEMQTVTVGFMHHSSF